MIRYKIVANERYEDQPRFMEGWTAVEDPAGDWVTYADVEDMLNRVKYMMNQLLQLSPDDN